MIHDRTMLMTNHKDIFKPYIASTKGLKTFSINQRELKSLRKKIVQTFDTVNKIIE